VAERPPFGFGPPGRPGDDENKGPGGQGPFPFGFGSPGGPGGGANP